MTYTTKQSLIVKTFPLMRWPSSLFQLSVTKGVLKNSPRYFADSIYKTHTSALFFFFSLKKTCHWLFLLSLFRQCVSPKCVFSFENGKKEFERIKPCDSKNFSLNISSLYNFIPLEFKKFNLINWFPPLIDVTYSHKKANRWKVYRFGSLERSNGIVPST